jgi:glycosyltransferase involved in cell wall biosynthesis
VPLQVRAFLPYPVNRVPGQRFRIEQWAPLLLREDVQVAFSPFLSPRGMDVLYQRGHTLLKIIEILRGCIRRFREARRVGSIDVAFVFREATLMAPAVLERRILGPVPMVLDFDDAIYLPPAHSANPLVARLKDAGKTDTLCRWARHVTVGNETLARHARRLSRAVTVLPTTIDTGSYVPSDRAAHPRPVVGWSGSLTTLPYLADLHDTLLSLRSRVDFELRVIGGEVRMPGLDVKCQPWRAETEVSDLQELDVGLMPLPDDPWTRGKCGLKALQYMALGIPAVVSPVGVNAEIVTNGVDGFHASTSDEWVGHLARLIGGPALRARLGAEARRTVETRFSAHVHAPRLAAVLREAAGK